MFIELFQGDVPPSQGGCWYCYTEGEDLAFSCEFDTYVHAACVRARMANYWMDRELRFIADEVLTTEEIRTLAPPEQGAMSDG